MKQHSFEHLKPLLNRAIAFGVILLGCVTLMVAQETGGDLTPILKKNLLLSGYLAEQLGMLGPVAISPYWGLCLASGASLFGLAENEFLLTHPFLGNWFVFVVFILFAVLTSIPNISKFSKALGVAANYLEDNTAIIIVGLTMFLPSLHQWVAPSEVGEFGVLGFSFYSLFILAFSSLYMFIVTTVRLFFELIAFVTPIPFVDTVTEILKKITSAVMMGIYFVSPEVAMGISILVLIIAFFLFRRANRSTQYFKQFYIAPITSWIFGKDFELVDDGIAKKVKTETAEVIVPVWTMTQFGKIKKKGRAWLVKDGHEVFLFRNKAFGRSQIEYLDDIENIRIRQDFNYLTVYTNEAKSKQFRISRSFFIHKDAIADSCGFMTEFKEAKEKGNWWQKIKDFFSFKQVSLDGEVKG